MPSYATHVSVNLLLGLPLSLAAMKYMASSSLTDLTAFSAAFIYGTLFFHPDLDLARNTRLFSIKGILSLPFRPYSYLFKHRGISHIPILGTLTRILWLGALFTLFYLFLDRPIPSLDEIPYLLFGSIGLMAADLFHITLDQLESAI